MTCKLWNIGEPYKTETTFCQRDLDLFSQISGDSNPIHTEEYARTHPEMNGVIVQGMLAASRFGEVLGGVFPGSGSINIGRNVTFLRPLYAGEKYMMEFILVKVDSEEHIGHITMEIQTLSGMTCVKGDTHVKNDNVFTAVNYPVMQEQEVSILQTIQLPPPETDGSVTLDQALLLRRSIRFIRKEELPVQTLSNVLWAACGVSKKTVSESGKESYLFTNPTASNHQEVKLYVFMTDGIYYYDPVGHCLKQVQSGDHRAAIGRLPMYKSAPVSICLVSDIDKMIHHTDDFRRNLYSSMDIGYVSENIYLYCAAHHLATCACGMIEREALGELLHLNHAKVMLVHPVGMRKH
jgi:SagB-type dehydrogenase family enzyme